MILTQKLELEAFENLPSTDEQISALNKKLAVLHMMLPTDSPYRRFVSDSLIKMAAIKAQKEANNA